MRDTPTVWPAADADPLDDAEPLAELCGAAGLEELEELEELQAASAAEAQRAAAAYAARRYDRRRAPPWVALFVELSMLLTPLRCWPRIDAEILIASLLNLGQRCLTRRMTCVKQSVKMHQETR
jgi:hypothetical protein